MSTRLGSNFARADRLPDLYGKSTVVIFAGLGGACIGIEQSYTEGGYRDKFIDLSDELFFEHRADVIPQVLDAYTTLRSALARNSVQRLRDALEKYPEFMAEILEGEPSC